jgi:hypothetical protein
MGRAVRRADSGSGGAAVKFLPTPLAGACVVEIEPREDDRGFFARGLPLFGA